MTIVEFFDEEAMDNAAGTFFLQPERTVFLCRDISRASAFAARLEKVLRARKIATKLICERINTSDISAAYKKITECISLWRDCDFDISGGDETLLVAIGMAAKAFDFPIHTVSVKSRRVYSMRGNVDYKVNDITLSCREGIEIHGGRIHDGKREKASYTWERNVGEEADIEKVWDICRCDCAAWNSALSTNKNTASDRRGAMTLIQSKLRAASLIKKGGDGVKYKNSLTEYLVKKQGTALEMFTYIAAKAAVTSEGQPFFDDGESGVVIDWRNNRCVENEIDVLLTRGMEMWFISCKNGSVTSEELYKLSTVASRFGGKYAKKILVLSCFEPDDSFMERADELNIKVVKNVRSMTKRALWRNIVK